MARVFAEFEPATRDLVPGAHRDLLKRLYQYLVPEDVRHNLGEYYTPDWLAELVLNEAGYAGNPRERFLDPACGSGTFLVLAIQRVRQYAAERREEPRETVKHIAANIWGFDLNLLAVIAARTNYIFALGDLLAEIPTLEIPVYLADSVLWPERAGQLRISFSGEHVRIPTSVGEFHVPTVWVKSNGFLMRRAAPLVESMAREHYSTAEAMARLRAEGLVFPPHEAAVEHFYEELSGLEAQGKNGIWARFLKNVFAPMMAGRFEWVIGNPPWIRWGYLSQDYRAATLPLWQEYGLFSLKGSAARLGAGEKDFSMLFTYAAIDHYLAPRGTLGFLITQEVFKSKGAGEGFRRFRLNDEDEFRVVKAHDLVQVQPFEGAANKTAMVVLRNQGPMKYPVPYTVWTRKRGVGRIPTHTPLQDALHMLTKRKESARPLGKAAGPWQTMTAKQQNLTALEGDNPYKARLGARVEPYGVFWVEIKEVLPNGRLIVRNLAERGKRPVPAVVETVEDDLVYPAITGADIVRWGCRPRIHVIICQDPTTSEPFPESRMKRDWPYTFGYLTKFKDILLSRGSKTVRELAERAAFYAMFGIGPYTVARYKVVWKRMAGDIIATVTSQFRTPFGYKIIIPTDTTSLFACQSEGNCLAGPPDRPAARA